MEDSGRGAITSTPAHVTESLENARFHFVKVETEPFQVKEEPKFESSTDCAEDAPGLYADHVVKDDLVLGPVQVDLPRRNKDDSSPGVSSPMVSYDTRFKGFAPAATTSADHDTVPPQETLKKTYSCKICKKEFRKDYIKIHERFHTGVKPYACEVCKKEFAVLTSLREHKRIHTEERPYACDICQKSFSSSSYLRVHKRIHTGKKPYYCGICKKGFTQMVNLKSHIRIHTGEKPYECPMCEKRFAQWSGLDKHKRTHTGKKPYSCEICKKGFTQMIHLKSHMRIHTGEEPYECPMCENKFMLLSSLKAHEVTHMEVNVVGKIEDNIVNTVNGEKRRGVEISTPELNTVPRSDTLTDFLHHTAKTNTYVSDSYDQTFPQRHDPIDHVETHLRDNPESLTNAPIEKVSCKICNKKFRKGYIKIHERIHTGVKPYACEVCKKEFSVLGNLKEHKLIHTEELPYACDICKKSFTRLTHLNVHKRSHTGERPYTCGVCKKGFTQISNLKSHIRCHTGEKPYGCPMCEKRFEKRSRLEKHKLSKHTCKKPYSSEICKNKFMQLSSLKTHKAIHTNEKKHTTFSCQMCKKNFRNLSSFEEHKRTHEVVSATEKTKCKSSADVSRVNVSRVNETGARTSMYAVSVNEKPACESSADACGVSETGNIVIKIELVLDSEGTQQSDVVTIPPATSTPLNSDAQTHTPQMVTPSSTERESIIPQESDADTQATAKTNIKENHSTTHKQITTIKRPYTCDICNKAFTQSGSLTTHKRIHTGEKPYSCKICDLKFTALGTLNNHSRRVHSNSFIGESSQVSCKICDKKFLKSYLKIHERLHTGVKPYACEICKKEFSVLSYLKEHCTRVHNEERPYSCEICKKSFVRLCHLKKHKQIHSGERPCTCEACKKGKPIELVNNGIELFTGACTNTHNKP